MSNKGYVYILASEKNGTLYVGVTSNLIKRIYQHRQDSTGGFTQAHKVKKLIYFEVFDTITDAITREKQLKNWHRDWKIKLLERDNPHWEDLYSSIL